jgi:hypothetical protein
MTVDDLCRRLEGVRSTRRGFTARCPVPSHGQGHGDRHGSLSVSAGDRGILLRCWANCTLEEITDSLSLSVRDLFYDADALTPDHARQLRTVRQARQEREELFSDVEGAFIDECRAADAVIAAATGLDISRLSDGQLDSAWQHLAEAYETLERDKAIYERG